MIFSGRRLPLHSLKSAVAKEMGTSDPLVAVFQIRTMEELLSIKVLTG